MAFKVHRSPPLSSENLGTAWFSHIIQRDEGGGLAGGASLCSMRRTRVSTDIPFRSRSIIRSTMTPARSPAMTKLLNGRSYRLFHGTPPISRKGRENGCGGLLSLSQRPYSGHPLALLQGEAIAHGYTAPDLHGSLERRCDRIRKSKADGRTFRPEAPLGIFLLFKLAVSLHFGTTVRTRSIGPVVQTLWFSYPQLALGANTE